MELTFTINTLTGSVATTPEIFTSGGVWTLIGFTASLTADKKTMEGTIFVDTSSVQFYVQKSQAMDISTVTTMKIGGYGSLYGAISSIRIMTPGGGITRTSNQTQGLISKNLSNS